jgi:hypothetical protein
LSCLVLCTPRAGRTLPAGEGGCAAGSLPPSHYLKLGPAVRCRSSPEFSFRFIWVLGWSTWYLCANDRTPCTCKTNYLRILMLFNIFLHFRRSFAKLSRCSARGWAMRAPSLLVGCPYIPKKAARRHRFHRGVFADTRIYRLCLWEMQLHWLSSRHLLQIVARRQKVGQAQDATHGQPLPSTPCPGQECSRTRAGSPLDTPPPLKFPRRCPLQHAQPLSLSLGLFGDAVTT